MSRSGEIVLLSDDKQSLSRRDFLRSEVVKTWPPSIRACGHVRRHTFAHIKGGSRAAYAF